MTMNLPPIVNRPYQEGDVVVYDGFVFSITKVEESGITVSNNCGDVFHSLTDQDISPL